MPVIYLVHALDERTGHFIHETPFTGLPALTHDLITGQFKGPGGTQPIQAVYEFDTDKLTVRDVSEKVLILVDSWAEKHGVELSPLLTRWSNEHMARKAASCREAMAPLTNLLSAMMSGGVA